MLLQALQLQNVRNYESFTLHLDPSLTLIVGPNAAGKTNIIESIFTLASGSPFRGEHDADAISWGKEIARIKGKLSDDTLEILITPGIVGSQKAPRKKFLVNGVARRMPDFVGKLPAVLFWPEDLLLVSGSPSIRRAYLNTVLNQVDRGYRRHLSLYEKALRQRNKLLHFIHDGEASRDQLPYWNSLVIESGQYLTKKREAFINFVNGLEERGGKEGSEIYHIKYDKSIISVDRLEQYKDAEIASKSTLVGPHRDDMELRIQKIENRKQPASPADGDTFVQLASFGSRGEQRLGVLWLKLAEVMFIEQEVKQKPLLLLDDIFSELDPGNRKHVLSLIADHQTVMTSAEEESITSVQDIESKKIVHLDQ